MVRNITRFTESVLTSQCMVGILNVSSVFEAEVCIMQSQRHTQPLLVALNFDSTVVARQVEYLSSMAQDIGSVVGIGAPQTNSLDEIRAFLDAGCSFVSFDVSDLSYDQAVEQAQYVTQLAHAQYAFVEILIGGCVKNRWQGVGKNVFDVQNLATCVQPDMIGLKVSHSAREVVSGGSHQSNTDFISDVYQKVGVPMIIHGGVIGASGLSGSLQKAIHSEYRSLAGISEHTCIVLSRYGVKYFSVEKDMAPLWDLAYRRCFENASQSHLIRPDQLYQEYQEITGQFFTYMYKLFSNTYELS